MKKITDCVLGIQTRGHELECAGYSTGLWGLALISSILLTQAMVIRNEQERGQKVPTFTTFVMIFCLPHKMRPTKARNWSFGFIVVDRYTPVKICFQKRWKVKSFFPSNECREKDNFLTFKTGGKKWLGIDIASKLIGATQQQHQQQKCWESITASN